MLLNLFLAFLLTNFAFFFYIPNRKTWLMEQTQQSGLLPHRLKCPLVATAAASAIVGLCLDPFVSSGGSTIGRVTHPAVIPNRRPTPLPGPVVRKPLVESPRKLHRLQPNSAAEKWWDATAHWIHPPIIPFWIELPATRFSTSLSDSSSHLIGATRPRRMFNPSLLRHHCIRVILVACK